jgi:NADH-quinone oxidoreductase subunit N
MTLDPSAILVILPEILLVVLAVIVLILDLALKDEQRRMLGWVTGAGLLFVIIPLLLFVRPGSEPTYYWGGSIRVDWLGFTFQLLAFFGAAITAILAMDYEVIGKRGELYLLLIISTLGMAMMVMAADLVLLYVAIETTSIPLYALAGMRTKNDKSVESGFKYLLFGAMASAIMLYGFSLLYGMTGQTNIYALAKVFALDPAAASPLLYGAAFIVLVGFAFKISAVPMHFWAPDVYEGAPTPIAGFLSTASKAAGFAVLLRVFLAAFPEYAVQWGTLLAIVSTITMTLGNMIALAQKNIKRLLAYSSIAHAGYALIGVAVASQLGAASVTYYMIAYLATNLAAFGVVGIYGRIVGSDEISAYAGLSRRSAGLALAMLVAFLSLAGMPPFGGFIAKIFVFAAAVQSGFIWLAVVGVLNSIIGLYYYLTVLKVVYLHRSEGDEVPLTVSRPSAFALGLLVAAILLVGILFTPWFNMASQAALAMF